MDKQAVDTFLATEKPTGADRMGASEPWLTYWSKHRLKSDSLPPAATDLAYRFRGYAGIWATCRLRIWGRPGAQLALATELPTNEGPSITNAAEVLWESVDEDFDTSGTFLRFEQSAYDGEIAQVFLTGRLAEWSAPVSDFRRLIRQYLQQKAQMK